MKAARRRTPREAPCYKRVDEDDAVRQFVVITFDAIHLSERAVRDRSIMALATDDMSKRWLLEDDRILGWIRFRVGTLGSVNSRLAARAVKATAIAIMNSQASTADTLPVDAEVAHLIPDIQRYRDPAYLEELRPELDRWWTTWGQFF